MSNIAKLLREAANGTPNQDRIQEIIDSIIQSPDLLIEKDESGIPLVHLLALMNLLHAVRDLLNGRLLETTWDLQGWTLAHTAAFTGCGEDIRELIGMNKRFHFWKDKSGRTPVFIAAQNKHLDQFAVEPSHLVIRDYLQSTPLHAAALAACLHQVADLVTPEMLLIINLDELTVVQLLERIPQEMPDTLKNAVWEADFLTNPKKRTVENVLEHAGIDPKLIFG